MSITKITDYVGFYQISKGGNQEEKLQPYIDNVESNFLMNLLGCDLYNLFISDIDPVTNLPLTDRFLNIYNAFSVDVESFTGCQKRSKGIKEMLKGFVYYVFVRDSDYFNTVSGNVKHQFSNSLSANQIEIGLTGRYNLSLVTYSNIQWYINENSTDYPEFNGINLEPITWL